MKDSWDKNIEGVDCPFDQPLPVDNGNLFLVRKLSVSSLYLDKNQTYSGHCVLVYDPKHIVRIDQLTPAEWMALAKDLHIAEIGIFKAMQADHINVESLGNVVAHLHWHITPRYKTDERWGAAIWTNKAEEMTVKLLSTDEYQHISSRINQQIDELVS